MAFSIYSPEVRAEALRSGITDLQAYRKVNAGPVIREQEARKRRGIVNRFIDRVCKNFERDHPDWNRY